MTFHRIATVLSYIFHPVFYFIFTFSYLLLASRLFLPFLYTYKQPLILTYLFSSTVLIPIVVIYFLNRDLQLRDQSKRTVPLFVLVAVYVSTYFFLTKLLLPPIILELMIGMIFIIILLVFVNQIMKVSLHSSGAGGILGFFLLLYFQNPDAYYHSLIGVFILTGIIGSSRLYLNEHKPVEVWAGYLLGMSCMIVVHAVL